MVDALKRASAKRITVVLPFYGYARQDKKHRGREPISARLMADLFKTAGADRLIAVDLHADQIQGFFDGPVDHLMALPILADYVREKYGDQQLAVVSPDAGRIKVAERWSARLGGAPLAFIHKTRRDRPAQRDRRQPRRRRGQRPDLRAGRRHDRHRRHDREGGRGADGRRRRRRDHRRDPRDPLRPRRRPAQELRRRPRSSSPTRCRSPTTSEFDKLTVPLDRAAAVAGDQRGLRGRLGHVDVRRPRPEPAAIGLVPGSRRRVPGCLGEGAPAQGSSVIDRAGQPHCAAPACRERGVRRLAGSPEPDPPSSANHQRS